MKTMMKSTPDRDSLLHYVSFGMTNIRVERDNSDNTTAIVLSSLIRIVRQSWYSWNH